MAADGGSGPVRRREGRGVVGGGVAAALLGGGGPTAQLIGDIRLVF